MRANHTKSTGRHSFAAAALGFFFCSGPLQSAPSTAFGQEPRLGAAEEAVEAHINQVLEQLPGFESYGREVAEQAVQDASSGNIAGITAPRQHPWSQSGNPNSNFDWFLDSFYNLDATAPNAMNWSQAWSCFEPKLLAQAKDGTVMVSVEGPGNEDLWQECRLKCINQVQHIPEPRGSVEGAIKYWLQYGCLQDPDPWGYTANGYEVVEYWYPENQVSINNYGINRINPEQLSATGALFTRQALIAQKTGLPESTIKQLIGESYPMDLADAKLLEDRSEPLIGQGVWGGYATIDLEDKSYGHVVRTWLSVTQGSKRKRTQAGWEVDPESSIYDALPPPKTEKDAVNLWTEYGLWDVVTSVPHFSYKARPDIMNAMFGSEREYTQAVVEDPPFWQSRGAAAFRIARWPQFYESLQSNFDIQPTFDPIVREAAYKGGYDLFPLVLNQSGFGAPTLSTGAVFARRVLYLAGARAPIEQGGDAGGELEAIFPQGAQRGRIATYTVNMLDKGLEIDKMQLIAPKRPKYASRSGGIPPIVSECFRSQNIPNLVNIDPALEQWAEGSLPYIVESSSTLSQGVSAAPGVAQAIKGNLPKTLAGYVSDTDALSLQGGDITITYWNRRLGCFCDRCGQPYGSTTVGVHGDGDVLYDKPRLEFCRYPLMPQMTPWSAWHKEDTFERCVANGKNDKFYDGTGLRDET